MLQVRVNEHSGVENAPFGPAARTTGAVLSVVLLAGAVLRLTAAGRTLTLRQEMSAHLTRRDIIAILADSTPSDRPSDRSSTYRERVFGESLVTEHA